MCSVNNLMLDFEFLNIFSLLIDNSMNCLDGVTYGMVGNGYCNDETNNVDCNYDGGDCCLSSPNTDSCSDCVCSTTGVITSPGFPGNYANDLVISWTIQVLSGQVIEIIFVSFDVEQYDEQEPYHSCG